MADSCRPNFTERKPLLVIFHDPPNFQDHADPTNGHRDLHNTWLVSDSPWLRTRSLTCTKTDVTKTYIDWAIRNDFQVIDVNIPKIVTVENEEVGRDASMLLWQD
jgi:histone deacetylase 6